MNREEPVQVSVIREIPGEQPCGRNGFGYLAFPHLHVPEGEHRFGLNEEAAAARVDYLADD